MFVNQLRTPIESSEKDHVLIERNDRTAQVNAIVEKDRNFFACTLPRVEVVILNKCCGSLCCHDCLTQFF